MKKACISNCQNGASSVPFPRLAGERGGKSFVCSKKSPYEQLRCVSHHNNTSRHSTVTRCSWPYTMHRWIHARKGWYQPNGHSHDKPRCLSSSCMLLPSGERLKKTYAHPIPQSTMPDFRIKAHAAADDTQGTKSPSTRITKTIKRDLSLSPLFSASDEDTDTITLRCWLMPRCKK